MPKIKNIWFPVLILLILIPPLFLHAFLGSFSRFLGDDYCSAYSANRFGVIRSTWYWYITWSGRFSASFLDSIFGLLGPKITPFVTPSVIAIWLANIGISVDHIVPLRKNRGLIAGLLAAAILFLTLNFAPHIQQSLYWGQGMRSVVPPLILGTAYAGLFFVIKDKEQINRKFQIIWYLLSFLLAYGIGGFSETYCVVQLMALGIGLAVLIFIFRYPIKGFAFNFLAAGFFGAVLSLITVLAAPGNDARAAFFPPHPGMFGILAISTESFFDFLKHLFSSLESIAGFLGVFFLSAWIGFEHATKDSTKRNLIVGLAGGLLLVFSCFPPAAYALSDAPPGRTLIIATYIISLLVIFCGYSIGSNISLKNDTLSPYFALTINLLLLISLFVSSFIVSQDLYSSRLKYIDFAKSWDKTHNTLLLLKNEANDVIVPAVVDEWSGVLRMADNPRFYVNTCVSNYYGFDSIVARDDLLPTKP